MATGLEKVSFHFNPKEMQYQRLLKLPHNCTHLTCRRLILKIPQARLQKYVNYELPKMFKMVLAKAEEPVIKLLASLES